MLLGIREKVDPTALACIKGWAAELFGLPPTDGIFVTQLQCNETGCPPLETAIATLGVACGMHRVTIAKAIVEVTREDLIHALQSGSCHHPLKL